MYIIRYIKSLFFLSKKDCELQKKIGYFFKNINLLKLALSHRSYTHAQKLDATYDSNERLEFLGDQVLDFYIAEYLYTNYSNKNEGFLSKTKSKIVCKEALSFFALKCHLNDFIATDNVIARSPLSDNILADGFEALLGAVYLDGGFKITKKVVNRLVISSLNELFHKTDLRDYKSNLIDFMRSSKKIEPMFTLVSEAGPDHAKHFVISIKANNEEIARGEGFSKKEAEKLAAKIACEKYGIVE